MSYNPTCWVRMKNTLKVRIKPSSSLHDKWKSENLRRKSKNLALWSDLPLEIRMKEAIKPIYLTRYE